MGDILGKLGELVYLVYCHLWFYAEFFIDNEKLRRPFTYATRDFALQHPWLYLIINLAICYGFWRVAGWWSLLMILYGFLNGHFFWGAPIQQGQQEYPEFKG